MTDLVVGKVSDEEVDKVSRQSATGNDYRFLSRQTGYYQVIVQSSAHLITDSVLAVTEDIIKEIVISFKKCRFDK